MSISDPEESDSEYHFVRQVDSEEGISENLKQQTNKEPPPPAPLLKKSITAGEAISKLNNILDVQARLQAFELPHDGPRRKFPRSEPISGSVRLAQLVSLERELKEAIYFRSLESRWTPITLREKLIKNEELAKLTEEFHKKLAEEAPSRYFGSITEKLSTVGGRRGQISVGSPQSRWPWPFPGKPGRKMWEPLPDTYLKPWEPWTKLREKPSLSFPRRKPGQQPPVESSSRHFLISKSKKPKKKPWDPATHRQRHGIITPVTPNTPRPVKTTTFQDSVTTINFGGFGPRTVSPVRGSTFFRVDPPANPSGNFKAARPKGHGYFSMPPLKAAVPMIETDSDDDYEDLELRPSLEMSTIFDGQQNSKGIKSEAAAAILGTTTSATDIPRTYPKPWQFFQYHNFGGTWDPTIYKPTGSTWEGIAGENLITEKVFRMHKMPGPPDSMDLSKNRSKCLMSNLSTEVAFSSAIVEIKSQLENSFDEEQRRLQRRYSLFSSNPAPTTAPDTRDANTPRPRSPLSTIHSRVTRKLAEAHVRPSPNEYVDRGLEGALVEVQKAIKTAIPTFKLDKAHKQLTAGEVQTDEWMKKFIDQMTHTAPHKPRPPRLPLEERRSTAIPKKPRSPLHFYQAPQPVPNMGDELIVFVVNGRPQIPEYTVGSPLNSYLFPPKSLEFLPHVCQRLTRCTVCRPYSFDGRQDPVAILRKFCRNIPLPGFRNDQIFFKMDVVNNKLIVNGLRHAKGDECYRNVTHALTIPDGINLLDLEVYRSDKGTLFFHDSREEARIQRRLQREHELMYPSSKKQKNKKEVEIKTIFKDNDYGYKTPGYFYKDD